MKLLIVIPAYNEEVTIGKVAAGLKKLKMQGIKKEVVIVNDGSLDKTEQEARKQKVTVLNHVINRGLGGALGTGFLYAKKVKADIVITFDADGQHKTSDIPKLIKPILNDQADVVIGSRMLGLGKMPLDRKIINHLANVATFLLWSVWASDTQSGLRAFSKKAINKIEIKANKMEVSSEFFKEIARNKLRLTEVPIKALYTDYSKRKGQKNANGVNVLVKLLVHKLAV